MNFHGKTKKINSLVFGGTFDPIHYGHIEIIKRIKQKFNPERFCIVPSGNPYMKLNKPLATPIQRYEMCLIALKYFSKLEFVDFEIHRSSPSYTYDTINFLNQKSGAPKIDTIVVGMDSFKEINLWKKGNELIRNYNFLVIKRSDTNFEISKFDNVILFDHISDLSSTIIRKKIFSNKTIVNDTPIEIVKYITDNNLYKNGK